MESVSAILKVVQAIAKAVRTARRNAASCQELAQRAQQVAKILPSSKAAASMLHRLRSALDDALELVESCGRRRRSGGGCLLSWPLLLATSGGLAAKFADVNARINNCLVDLQTANGVRIEEKINRQAANGSRIEKKLDKLAAGSRDQRRANNSSQREINASKNGNNNGGWNKGGGQQNGGKGSKRRRGKKAAGPAPPPPQQQQPQLRPRAGAGVPFCHVHPHHHSMEEDPTSCSVM